MKSLRFLVPLLVFAGFVGLAGYMLTKPKDDFVHSRMIGKPLPFFDLRPATEGRAGLSSREFTGGKPRLLNIFASWCLPCAAEAPQLARLAQQGVEIDGIAIRDRPEDVAAFLARNGNPFRAIGADDLSEVQLAMGSSGVPETFVVDGRGRIAYQHMGDIRPEDVAVIMQKLAEAGS